MPIKSHVPGIFKNGWLHKGSVLFAMLILAGCADIPKEGLKPVTPALKLELKERFAYPIEPGMPAHFTLSEGTYVGSLSDEKGVFYLGPSGCYQNFNPELDLVVIDDCGIYIPTARGQAPRVFHVVGARRAFQPAGTAVITNRDPSEFTQSIANTVPNATPLQAGVGGAIAGGIIASIEARRQGNYQFLGAYQPPVNQLRKAINFVK